MKNVIKKITSLFADKKKRTIYLFLFILPFLVLIGVFGLNIYKEVKNIIGLATNEVQTDTKHIINDGQYVLRDNATELQETLFAQLKETMENSTGSDADAAALVCENFVADFYTLSNKTAQYDVGGTYYVYSGIDTEFYTQARDEFYKYLNEYINKYGSENLLEVETVNVVSSKKADEDYVTLHKGYDEEQNEYWYDITYDTYEVTCEWTYKANEVFNSGKYIKKQNFIVILNNGKFEIAEVSK